MHQIDKHAGIQPWAHIQASLRITLVTLFTLIEYKMYSTK